MATQKNTGRRVLVMFLAVLVVVGALATLYTWFALSWAYSEGERAGYLQTFSKKGWVCKTWEGEILLSSMPGAIPERFAFSVRDDAVAKQLLASMGKRVQLSYKQHKGIPTQCFGETEYYVSGVQTGPEQPLSPSQAPARTSEPNAQP